MTRKKAAKKKVAARRPPSDLVAMRKGEETVMVKPKRVADFEAQGYGRA